MHYFEIDEKWNLPVKFRVNETQEIIEIPTSAGFSKTFKAYGLLAIHIDGDYFPLTAYKRVLKEGQEHSDHPTLFVPFKDLTTGGSTYGGGRYMDIEIPEDDSELYLDLIYATVLIVPTVMGLLVPFRLRQILSKLRLLPEKRNTRSTSLPPFRLPLLRNQPF